MATEGNQISAIMSNLDTPCKVVNVTFAGVRRTRQNLLAKVVADVFPATTLIDCVTRAVDVRESMKSLNVFSDVEMQIVQVGKTSDNEVEVKFNVKELGRLTAAVRGEVETNDRASGVIELISSNLTGMCDSIKFKSIFGHKKSGSFSYTVPFAPWRSLWNPVYSIFYSRYQTDSPSGYKQTDNAFVNQVEMLSHSNVHHSLSFDNVWRFLKCDSVRLPAEIREHLGHSVKSSLKHEVTIDNREGGNFPSGGIFAKFTNEITTNLITGGAKFSKHEANLQFNARILTRYDVLGQLNLIAGTLLKPTKTNICDKFYAGGPLTLRGFKLHGLGPNVNGFPLGDMSFLSAGLHFYSILPFTNVDTPINEFIRPHVFFNTGTIGDIEELRRLPSENLKQQLFKFRDSLRYSCGIGLVMYFLRLRLEVNYCIPLIFESSDLDTTGLQWGFGLIYS